MPADTRNQEPQIPTTSEGRKKLFEALVAKMGTDAARQELDKVTASITRTTGEQARVVVGDAGKEKLPPSRLFSFSESEAFLREHGVDLKLGEAREDDVRSMIRWGALDIKSADQYGASFDSMDPISEADLKELIRQIKAEPDLEQRVILGVDNMTRNEGFQRLIVEAGLRHYIYRRLSEYKKVDAKTRQPLQDQGPTGKAGILFTPNHLNLPANLREISPNDQLAKMANGQKYVGPVGWMKLFRQSVDRALPILYPEEGVNIDSLQPEQYKALVQKALLDPHIDKYLPDVTTGTQFPDLRHKDDGAVPSLHFISYC